MPATASSKQKVKTATTTSKQAKTDVKRTC